MNENSGVKVCEYHNQKCPTPFQTITNTPILYLEITDQLLVTDNGFLEKPDQGSGTQGSVENISNKLPLRYPYVTQSIAHTFQFSPTD